MRTSHALLTSALVLGLASAPTLPAQSATPPSPPTAAASVEARLQALEDRQAITQRVLDYGTSFDRKDWALHRSLFTDEIEMDFSASIGAGLTTMKADDWVAAVRPFFEALQGTQHIGMPLSIRIEDDIAQVTTMLHAQHHLPNNHGEAVQRMIGSYDVTLIRVDGEWKIRRMVQHITWNEGNWYVFLKAAGQAK